MSDEIQEVRLELHALQVFRAQLKSLEPFFADDAVTEIMVNRADEVWVESKGEIRKVDVELTPASIRSAIKALASANDKDVQAVLDCRMPGVRVAAALEPVAIKGSALCIRKHAKSKRTLQDYVDQGGFEPGSIKASDENVRPSEAEVRQGGEAVARLLTWIVRDKQNVVIAGATGSGKTTFLNALLAEIPHSERVVTIEDTAELQVATPNHVGLESSPDQGVTIRTLVKLSLRFRPDRIVVGEIRGAEAYDLMDAMNTGHSGGACSLHADSARLALSRLESMVRMNPDAANLPLVSLRRQIAETVGFVVYCSRRGERRGPEQILEVVGVKDDGSYETKVHFDARGNYEH